METCNPGVLWSEGELKWIRKAPNQPIKHINTKQNPVLFPGGVSLSTPFYCICLNFLDSSKLNLSVLIEQDYIRIRYN